ncbi:unnamed protein product [Staurois parvus]|uniref:Uncharacterized protein n=1 Tax=Staurois parvus TaxID=386267 RepID=A0ABN9DPF0_9NEOB|nr:unnamed protein product [Staurois parvus]
MGQLRGRRLLRTMPGRGPGSVPFGRPS